MSTIHVDVVSAEASIFSGEAKFVALPGESGELGILPKHTPLITRIKPGAVRIEKADGEEEFVFVAGGIGRGEAILAYLEMGAAGVQLGTRFVCATECIAHPRFKQAFLRAAARDAVPTIQLDERFPVIPVRALVNEGTKEFLRHQAEVLRRFTAGEVAKDAAQLEIEHFWAGALKRAVIDGDVENGSVMAGQSVGLVTREAPCAEILAELVEQSVAAIAQRIPEKVA